MCARKVSELCATVRNCAQRFRIVRNSSELFGRGRNASEFLAEAPVPYPSYTDPSKDIAHEIGATGGVPDTAFYDRAGQLCFLKPGPYTKPAELEADVRHYALAEECESG